jgi:hypothetical protein
LRPRGTVRPARAAGNVINLGRNPQKTPRPAALRTSPTLLARNARRTRSRRPSPPSRIKRREGKTSPKCPLGSWLRLVSRRSSEFARLRIYAAAKRPPKMKRPSSSPSQGGILPDTSIVSRCCVFACSLGETACRLNAVRLCAFRTLSHKALAGQRLRFLASRQLRPQPGGGFLCPLCGGLRRPSEPHAAAGSRGVPHRPRSFSATSTKGIRERI